MFKKLTLVAAAVLSMASAANAATITLNKGLNPGFTVQTNTGVATQSFVFVGTFAGGANFSGDVTQIASNFNIFGPAVSIASGAAISGAVDYSGLVEDELFETLKIFIVVANSANLATASQIGVFGNTPVTTFPADVAAAGSSNFNVNTFGSVEVISGFGSKVDNATGADVLRLVPVPEPSAALLGAFGVVALLRRRR